MIEKTLFQESLAKPPAERAAFLDKACGGQPQLRAAVEALLAAHEASGSFHSGPTAEGREPTGDYLHEPEAVPGGVLTAAYQPPAQTGTVIAGRYTLQEKIGEGGMGEVWKVRNQP